MLIDNLKLIVIILKEILKVLKNGGLIGYIAYFLIGAIGTYYCGIKEAIGVFVLGLVVGIICSTAIVFIIIKIYLNKKIKENR